MLRRWMLLGAACAAGVAGCATAPVVAPARPVESRPAVAAGGERTALTLDAYKQEFARRIAGQSPDVFEGALPEMLKSVVVVDVTIDRGGGLARVAVRRSNGYAALEAVALERVRGAAPYAPPDRRLQRADGSISFLETFLFRDDGRFRIRSLVE